MLQDAILVSFVFVLVGLGTIAFMRVMVKKKRERRPVHNFRLN